MKKIAIIAVFWTTLFNYSLSHANFFAGKIECYNQRNEEVWAHRFTPNRSLQIYQVNQIQNDRGNVLLIKKQNSQAVLEIALSYPVAPNEYRSLFWKNTSSTPVEWVCVIERQANSSL